MKQSNFQKFCQNLWTLVRMFTGVNTQTYCLILSLVFEIKKPSYIVLWPSVHSCEYTVRLSNTGFSLKNNETLWPPVERCEHIHRLCYGYEYSWELITIVFLCVKLFIIWRGLSVSNLTFTHYVEYSKSSFLHIEYVEYVLIFE